MIAGPLDLGAESIEDEPFFGTVTSQTEQLTRRSDFGGALAAQIDLVGGANAVWNRTHRDDRTGLAYAVRNGSRWARRCFAQDPISR